jgi:hypothetical protein
LDKDYNLLKAAKNIKEVHPTLHLVKAIFPKASTIFGPPYSRGFCENLDIQSPIP